MRDVLLDERHHRVGGDRLARDHERLRHLAALAVDHRDDRRVGDVRVLQQQRLELCRCHLEALDLDELLQPIDDLR